MKTLPCPFCGGDAVVEKDTRYPFGAPRVVWLVHCSDFKCLAYNTTSRYYPRRKDAIEAWNTRAYKETA